MYDYKMAVICYNSISLIHVIRRCPNTHVTESLDAVGVVCNAYGRVEERERSPPQAALSPMDCAALVHPTSRVIEAVTVMNKAPR